MELLDCYRVIRVRATHAEWEQAIRGCGHEVQMFVERRLAENKDTEYVTITLGESPYRYTLGRSIAYYADAFRRAGHPLIWQHNGREFTPTISDDGRAKVPVASMRTEGK